MKRGRYDDFAAPGAFLGEDITRTRLVLFLLVGDLEVLIQGHVVIAVLALDVVGLITVALGRDVAIVDRAAGWP